MASVQIRPYRSRRCAWNIVCLGLILALVASLSGCTPGVGCIPVQLGQVYSGTLTVSDIDDVGWRADVYCLDVQAGGTYLFTVSDISGGDFADTIGIWNQDSFDNGNGYIVITVPSEPTVQDFYTFTTGGRQELWVETPHATADHAVSYSFSVTR